MSDSTYDIVVTIVNTQYIIIDLLGGGEYNAHVMYTSAQSILVVLRSTITHFSACAKSRSLRAQDQTHNSTPNLHFDPPTQNDREKIA